MTGFICSCSESEADESGVAMATVIAVFNSVGTIQFRTHKVERPL